MTELFVRFLVFFVVYGSLHYFFTERKKKMKDGQVQPRKRAVLRTAATSTAAGVLFIVFFEVIEII